MTQKTGEKNFEKFLIFDPISTPEPEISGSKSAL